MLADWLVVLGLTDKIFETNGYVTTTIGRPPYLAK